MPEETLNPSHTVRPRLRAVIYCVLIGVLASVLLFWELGADALTSDEAQYALVAQNIRQPDRSWMYVTPYPPTPYFQKPPLYFWLTAATYNLLGQEEFAFRAWSAAAGVGAIVLTCAFGAMLFSPETGAFAAMLLMLNRSFLLIHGARSGTFDALVACLIAGAMVTYWLTLGSKRWWLGWIAVGVLLGLASMTKPFVGLVLIVVLAPHALMCREVSIQRRLGGLTVAVVVLFLVAAPWFFAQSQKYPAFTNEMIRQNIVERAIKGVDDKHVQEWSFYLEQVSKSSWPFLLVIPASLHTLAGAFRGDRRSANALLALWGVGWIALFSFSASKAIHYAYPAFPALAIMLAHGGVRFFNCRGRRAAAPVMAVVLVVFTFNYTRTLYSAIPAERSPYAPWEMHQTLSPAIDADEARVVFYGFPQFQTDWRSQMKLRARDCYYLMQMLRPGTARLQQPGELADLLKSKKPTLLVLSRQANLGELLPQLNLSARIDQRFVYTHQGYLMLGLDLADLLSPAATGSGKTSRHVNFTGESAPGIYRFAITPPVRGSGRVNATFHLAAGATEVRYLMTLESKNTRRKRIEDHVVRPINDVIEISAPIEEELWDGDLPYSLTIELRQTEPRPTGSTEVTLKEVRLTMTPTTPPEPHPRR